MHSKQVKKKGKREAVGLAARTYAYSNHIICLGILFWSRNSSSKVNRSRFEYDRLAMVEVSVVCWLQVKANAQTKFFLKLKIKITLWQAAFGLENFSSKLKCIYNITFLVEYFDHFNSNGFTNGCFNLTHMLLLHSVIQCALTHGSMNSSWKLTSGQIILETNHSEASFLGHG